MEITKLYHFLTAAKDNILYYSFDFKKKSAILFEYKIIFSQILVLPIKFVKISDVKN